MAEGFTVVDGATLADAVARLDGAVAELWARNGVLHAEIRIPARHDHEPAPADRA